MSVLSEGKCPHGDQSVVKHRDHGRNAVNPLKPEAQVNQHPQQRIKRGQAGLRAQLAADLRTDDLDVAYAEVGNDRTPSGSEAATAGSTPVALFNWSSEFSTPPWTLSR